MAKPIQELKNETSTETEFERLLGKGANLSEVKMGFDTAAGFALLQRAAKALCQSTMVPPQYRQTIEKLDKFGNIKESRPNPNGFPNCIVALNMAARLKADPLMIMQNLYPIEGRPSWSSQYVIAAINSCGRYSPLRFDVERRGNREFSYEEAQWVDGNRRTSPKKIMAPDMTCIAWAVERESGERFESIPITTEMAVSEGWYQKPGSKWQTMPDQMIRYRAAAFFGRIYAPEILMGLRTYEEEVDMRRDVEELAHAAIEIADTRQTNLPRETHVSVAGGEVFDQREHAADIEFE